MDNLGELLHGFSIAITLPHLALMVIGVLLGILVGEQVIPLVKRVSSGEAVAFLRAEAAGHVFGRLPGDHPDQDA